MQLSDIQSLAQQWIQAQGRYCDMWDMLDNLTYNEPLTAFRIIEEIHWLITADTIDYDLMGLLAAGHLEDLLARNGPAVIDAVEALAKHDAEFRKCLTGVWQQDMDDKLYARVQKAADPNWKFHK